MTLVLVTATAVGQGRLVIDVSKGKRSRWSSSAVHYQPTASVRHSEQRSYQAAQVRRSVQEAQRREESQGAKSRRTAQSQSRRASQAAESRSFSQATHRHGSVQLDNNR